MAGHRRERPPITGRIATVTPLQTAGSGEPVFTSDEPADYRIVVGDLTAEGMTEVAALLNRHGYLYNVEKRSGFST